MQMRVYNTYNTKKYNSKLEGSSIYEYVNIYAYMDVCVPTYSHCVLSTIGETASKAIWIISFDVLSKRLNEWGLYVAWAVTLFDSLGNWSGI